MRFYAMSVAMVVGMAGSCGRTTVDTGKNAQRPDDPTGSFQSEQEPSEIGSEHPSISQPEIPGGPHEVRPHEAETERPVAPAAESIGSTAAAKPSPGKITCFGPSADVAPAELKQFCESIPEDLKGFYQTAHRLLCAERKLHNLFLAQCGWTGDNEFKSFFQVIEKTALREKSEEFYYLSTASLTLGPSPHSYPDMALIAYSNPTEFVKKFHLPAGALIIPDGAGVVQSGAAQSARYKFEVNGLTKTSFDGEIRVVPYGENLRVVFNTAIGGYEGLKKRQNLSLVTKLADGREKIVVIEERLVPDAGQHEIAWSKMLKLDQVELENRMKNSKVK